MVVIEKKMKRTYLIQRLKKPLQKSKLTELAKSFSFGAGYQNGGLSKEAMKIIEEVWHFDYMGSAEFEFGAVPDSLSEIWQYCKKKKHHIGKISLQKEVYYLCHKDDKEDVEGIISKLADEKLLLKEASRFKESLEGAQDISGWLELDNHFLFFIDKKMFEKTLIIMGRKDEIKNK